MYWKEVMWRGDGEKIYKKKFKKIKKIKKLKN
jgi:hypothetical protein